MNEPDYGELYDKIAELVSELRFRDLPIHIQKQHVSPFSAYLNDYTFSMIVKEEVALHIRAVTEWLEPYRKPFNPKTYEVKSIGGLTGRTWVRKLRGGWRLAHE